MDHRILRDLLNLQPEVAVPCAPSRKRRGTAGRATECGGLSGTKGVVRSRLWCGVGGCHTGIEKLRVQRTAAITLSM